MFFKRRKKKTLTIKVTAQLSFFFPILVKALCLQLLPLEFIFLLDLQVAVQLRLTHRRQRHLWGRRAGQNNDTQKDGGHWRWPRTRIHSVKLYDEDDTTLKPSNAMRQYVSHSVCLLQLHTARKIQYYSLDFFFFKLKMYVGAAHRHDIKTQDIMGVQIATLRHFPPPAIMIRTFQTKPSSFAVALCVPFDHS